MTQHVKKPNARKLRTTQKAKIDILMQKLYCMYILPALEKKGKLSRFQENMYYCTNRFCLNFSAYFFYEIRADSSLFARELALNYVSQNQKRPTIKKL